MPPNLRLDVVWNSMDFYTFLSWSERCDADVAGREREIDSAPNFLPSARVRRPIWLWKGRMFFVIRDMATGSRACPWSLWKFPTKPKILCLLTVVLRGVSPGWELSCGINSVPLHLPSFHLPSHIYLPTLPLKTLHQAQILLTWRPWNNHIPKPKQLTKMLARPSSPR